MITAEWVSRFVAGYVDAALWTHEEFLRQECERIGVDPVPTGIQQWRTRLAPDALDQLTAQAEAFLAAHGPVLAGWFEPGHAGYDLWMTRSGEGVGYWARDLFADPVEIFSPAALAVRSNPGARAQFEEATAAVSHAARALRELSLWVDDDDQVIVI